MALGRVRLKMCFKMFTSGTSAPPPTHGTMYTAEQMTRRRMPLRGPVRAEMPPVMHHPVNATMMGVSDRYLLYATRESDTGMFDIVHMCAPVP